VEEGGGTSFGVSGSRGVAWGKERWPKSTAGKLKDREGEIRNKRRRSCRKTLLSLRKRKPSTRKRKKGGGGGGIFTRQKKREGKGSTGKDTPVGGFEKLQNLECYCTGP